ncbi:hypothetical protein PAAG_06681 [Paracoccidioides lutzii Pb01]|uniref:PH-response regulator protein palI/RIM9 n=1 Tax=Paracoccidioides lutzii (strain ATCC MYA-826 / Pb01) TaxID=502779 RepID=C1H7E0_PARBA|nr:hypothetical protein PAAG_06681 [Paracoccidioides lutzii Pb01]EEH35634.2 hypothetical protein PAAG_06681 [Paracoccidioides lutzii Pb01]
MMLRPATPLSVLLLTAFVLLLLSVLSTPVVKSIPLAGVGNIKFGIFGYCVGNNCTPIRVGYSSNGPFGDFSRDSDFSLPSSVRHSLSSLLIVHPVAAFLTLTCFGLAAAAHFHSPSHSPRYLLGLLILLLPTLLVSLLAFLVDILLFVPHLEWGGWIVLAATIMITASGVLTCAMRRTLVSRKARKRRIAENAEMSGENFYNRQNAVKLDPPAPVKDQTGIAFSNSTSPDSLPTFALFEASSRSPDDDRQPLNSVTPSSVTPDGSFNFRSLDNRRNLAGHESRPYNSPVDEYGNILPPGDAASGPPYLRGPRPDTRPRNQFSNSSMGFQRGRGPSYGPPRGRGGYSMRGRGSPYNGLSNGPRRPFPHGGYGMGSRGGPMGSGMMGRGRGPPPGYPPAMPGDGYSPYGPGLTNQDGYGNMGGRVDCSHGGPRGPSPVPPGSTSSIEMKPALSNVPVSGPGREPQTLADDSGARGVVGFQPDEHTNLHNPQNPDSMYSEQEVYVPPRAAWEESFREPTLPVIEPNKSSSPHTGRRPSSAGPDIDLRDNTQSPIARSNSRDNYYEDLDPRFAEPVELPQVLTPGQPGELQPRTSFDDMTEGARSPAASETSHFTSISQRGVNPKWSPAEVESRNEKQRRQDMLLGNNPDFELPVGRGRGGAASRRMPAAQILPPVPSMPSMPSTVPNDGGRYPPPQ